MYHLKRCLLVLLLTHLPNRTIGGYIGLPKKVKAGVDFIQTQCIYNMERFKEWLKRANDMGLTEKVFILAGITPLKSVGMARYMQNKVPGMDVPEELIKRLKSAGKEKAAEEGIKIACEQIEEFKELKGVAGVHLMAIEWEHRVPEIARGQDYFLGLRSKKTKRRIHMNKKSHGPGRRDCGSECRT